MKAIGGIFLAAALLLTTLVTAAPRAMAEERSCVGTIGAVTLDNVRVPQNSSCTLNGTQLKGNILVERGATLTASRVVVVGQLQADGARAVTLSNSRINGAIQFKQGGKLTATSNTVGAGISIISNVGPSSSVSRNAVTGDIQAFSNSGGLSITSNRVNGNLQCKDNNPITGSGNVVQGNKQDQCARF